jgi:hypothetical protein
MAVPASAFAVRDAAVACLHSRGDAQAYARTTRTCPDPEANEPYCCSEAGIPLYPECREGELVCPEGTRDCASFEQAPEIGRAALRPDRSTVSPPGVAAGGGEAEEAEEVGGLEPFARVAFAEHGEPVDLGLPRAAQARGRLSCCIRGSERSGERSGRH